MTASGLSVAPLDWRQDLDASPALVWLKDLDGRYLQVNRRYTEVLGTSSARLLGHTDEELPAAEVVDGPRLLGNAAPLNEPLQLEYTIGPFQRRPALAVLRFPVRDEHGQPVAVCGVAAPVAEAHVARSECSRLMNLPWPSIQVPTEVEPEPELPSEPQPAFELAIAERDAAIAEREALQGQLEDLQRELGEGQRRIAALHEASATAARRAHELMSALTQEQERRAELERALEREPAASDPAEVHSLREQLEEEQETARTLQTELIAARRRPQHEWSAEAQRALGAALYGASEWRTGLKDSIRVLGTQGGWDAVAVWSPAERSSLRCVATWTPHPDQRTAFETLTWQRPEPLTESVFGRAAQSTHALAVGEIETSADHRLKLAAAEGMRTAVLVPVRDGVQLLALIELLSCDAELPDPELLISMEAVALQLAHFAHLLRLATRPHWRFGRI